MQSVTGSWQVSSRLAAGASTSREDLRVLPLYPRLKESLESLFLDMAIAASRQELGPFNESPRFIQHEGTSHSYNTMDGQERQTEYQDMSVEELLSSSDIANMSLADALRLAVKTGRQLGVQQARYHYGMLNQIIEEAGNTVSGPLTLDTFFETIERIFITFDDYGNPHMPTMVAHPNMTPRVQELERALETEEAKARLAEIMDRKREQWDEEQDRRKLVD
jgi:hypothetical protein